MSHLSWQASLFPRPWPAPWSGACLGRKSSKVILGRVLSVQCAVPFEPVHNSEMESLEVTLGLGDRRLVSSAVSVVGFTLKRRMFGALHPTAQSRSSKPNKPQTLCCCLVYRPRNFPTCSSNLVMSISSDCAASWILKQTGLKFKECPWFWVIVLWMLQSVPQIFYLTGFTGATCKADNSFKPHTPLRTDHHSFLSFLSDDMKLPRTASFNPSKTPD